MTESIVKTIEIDLVSMADLPATYDIVARRAIEEWEEEYYDKKLPCIPYGGQISLRHIEYRMEFDRAEYNAIFDITAKL